MTEAGQSFSPYEQGSPLERQAIERAKSRVLDVGCASQEIDVDTTEQIRPFLIP